MYGHTLFASRPTLTMYRTSNSEGETLSAEEGGKEMEVWQCISTSTLLGGEGGGQRLFDGDSSGVAELEVGDVALS